MSSDRRIASSRANGALSHGPATPEGQARSHAARIIHGLASRRVIIETESEDEFRAFHESFLNAFSPANPIEQRLVDQYVAASWRLDRIGNIETALLDLEMARQQPEIDQEFDVCDADTRAAIAFQNLCDKSTVLPAVSRYEARYRRAAERALKTLTALREKQKPHHEPSPGNEHP
jgi:hypothetical protein